MKMATIHSKQPVTRDGEFHNEWFVDVTLNNGQRIQGIALFDWGGSDFYDRDGNSIAGDTNDDWLDIVNANNTTDEWLEIPE